MRFAHAGSGAIRGLPVRGTLGIRKRIQLVVPTSFSIRNNPSETLEFFDAVITNVEKRKKVFIDLQNTENITEDAILYYLSLKSYYLERKLNSDITGNLPDNLECLQLLRSSGFFNYVKSRQIPRADVDQNVFQIVSGKLVLGPVARDVVVFAREHLGEPKSERSSMVTSHILEAMQNCVSHAYDSGSTYREWSLMARRIPAERGVRFTVLDNGQGIPTTIRRTRIERLQSLFSGAPDHELILSALEGKVVRSRTGERHRGQGLPEVFNASLKGDISDFMIASNYGIVRNGVGNRLPLKFQGTLMSWVMGSRLSKLETLP